MTIHKRISQVCDRERCRQPARYTIQYQANAIMNEYYCEYHAPKLVKL